MIAGALTDMGKYRSLNRYFGKVCDYLLAEGGLADLPAGRYEIDGDNVFVTVVEADLKPEEKAPLEVHDKYIDIQIVISGDETFGWGLRKDCVGPIGEYDPPKDILFFDDKPSSHITLHEGQFVVFFPEDAHAPLIGKGKVKKCIFKVKV